MFELCEVAFDSICTFELEFADCWLADDFVLVVAGGIVLQGLFRFKRCVEMPLRNVLLFRWGRFWVVQSIKIFPRGFWRRLNLCWSDIRWSGLIYCCYRSLWWCSRWYRWFRCGRMCWCFSNKKIINRFKFVQNFIRNWCHLRRSCFYCWLWCHYFCHRTCHQWRHTCRQWCHIWWIQLLI